MIDADAGGIYARRMDQVAPGIYALGGLKMGRSYIVEGDDGIALIDSSSAGVSGRILSAIAATGHRPEDLRAIVATHYHHDHTGNVAALVERTGAQLFVHALDVPYVDGRSPWMPTRPPFQIVDRFGPKEYSLKVDRVLHEGDVLPFGGGLEVLHAPGHTPGHIALYAKQRRVLFAGDALMNVLGLRLPMSISTHDMAAARTSAKRIAALDYDVALPGHGAPILSQASEKIAAWTEKWL